jgi:hypothetical protein
VTRNDDDDDDNNNNNNNNKIYMGNNPSCPHDAPARYQLSYCEQHPEEH